VLTVFFIDDKSVGIEITTLNGFVADWIFTERLAQGISSCGFLNDKTIRIKHSLSRILQEFRKNTLYEYIHEVGEGIANNNETLLQDSGISFEIAHRWAGCISWEISGEDEFQWLSRLTEDLYNKITTSKKSQLKGFEKNIIFVGVNNVAPTNWAIPSVFDEIGRGGVSYTNQIAHISEFWKRALQPHDNIMGICFFCYSLDREVPFYPLKVFWRYDSEQANLNF
jgi:hypothetical protein